MKNLALNYSDIYLVPRYSELKSRSEADISVEFLGRKFKAPWIPANMAAVINPEIAKWLSENDYFYIMHRFGDNYEFVKNASINNWKLISISIGVKQQDKDFLIKCLEDERRIDYITIDIAHGDSILMKEMIFFIKNIYSKYNFTCPKIIAGNVCTRDSVKNLTEWGADAIKAGIAGGGACSTKVMTGFHIPMFSCIEDCSAEAKIPIIADGGIKDNGDIAKALVAGATMVMAGSLFAACEDAPGENIYSYKSEHYTKDNLPYIKQVKDKIIKKRYYGSASAKNKQNTNQEVKHIEGFEVELPCNGLTYAEKYLELADSLKSSVSYAGGWNLESFNSVNYITLK